MGKTEDIKDLDNYIDIFKENFIFAIEEGLKQNRNKEMMYLRYGLYDAEYFTLQEIGERYNISRERVRQVINSSLNQIIKRGNKDYPNCRYFLDEIINWVSPGSENDILNISLMIMRLEDFPRVLMINLICRICFQDCDMIKDKEKMVFNYVSTLQNVLIESEIEREKQKRVFNRIFKHVVWQSNKTKISLNQFKTISPKRKVGYGGSHYSGSFYSKKNNINIEYESGLEYKFCLYLEGVNRVIGYIQQPLKISYLVNGKTFSYCPDFLILLEDHSCVLVEIKPRSRMALYENLIKYKALQRYCEQNGLGYLIIEKNQSITDCILHKVDPLKEKAFLSYLEDQNINWIKYKALREELGLVSKDFVSLIINNNLIWTLPFLITKSDKIRNDFKNKHLSLIKQLSTN